MRTGLIIALTAVVTTACWESGTDAPPPSVTVSPLADAGGRFRPTLTSGGRTVETPRLIRSGTNNLSGNGQYISLGATNAPAPGNTLVVAVATRELSPTRVTFGQEWLKKDAELTNGRLYVTFWSIRVTADRTPELELSWSRALGRGLLVWMEWANLDGASTVSRRDGTRSAVTTNLLSGIERGTLLLAAAVADSSVGSVSDAFTPLEVRNNGVFGLALGYTVADQRATYEATFGSDAATGGWLTLVVPYVPLSSAP